MENGYKWQKGTDLCALWDGSTSRVVEERLSRLSAICVQSPKARRSCAFVALNSSRIVIKGKPMEQ
ncbi:hypothetical protein M514_02674 [Trichuris suis]|uniref:Uncharacterized protein n=1 Tax=Trichuris suis TaxID=68888 RepID=A0A085MH74_9BILA|nr:hypothetical protein M513_02674 [Trichuris suis]KFD71096.1 hypothetical protein M514_02674 [Trichuris suis]